MKRRTHRILGIAAILWLLALPLLASDHADPIDPFNRERLEGGITDLFAFPVKRNGEVAFPFQRSDAVSLATPDIAKRAELTAEQQKEIDALIVILCVRRQLTETKSLRLMPYTYRIHMDLYTTVSFDDSPEDIEQERRVSQGSGYQPATGGGGGQPLKRPTGQEARARYGGLIMEPKSIEPHVTIELRLNNDASLNGAPKFTGNGLKNTGDIEVHTGVHDDPFIFPAFFGTNVVAMVLRIPMSCFPDGQQNWLIWGTSSKGDRQIDHVGRSLRTQNPRFDMLNKLPPNVHAARIREEHEHPGLIRDLALRFNMQSLFAYRAWDQVPDVMIYSRRFPVGFPNGRVLTDDVAAILAQHGDTLLLELSHHIGGWPRMTTNDKAFSNTFPYLAEPWPDKPPRQMPGLTSRNKWILLLLATGVIAFWLVSAWLFARWYVYRRERRRYL
jgi:hypothetical protein